MKTGDISVIATEKQQRAISFIENTLETTFTGTTKREVFEYIREYLPKARFCKSLEAEMNIPVYAARFSTRDDDGEEYCNKRNGVANELLKRDMLQGKSGSEALAEVAEKSFCEFAEDIISPEDTF